MFNIGGGELIVILLIALIVLGPQKLPEAARQLGRATKTLRSISSGFQEEMKRAMDDPVEAMARERGAAIVSTEEKPAPESTDTDTTSQVSTAEAAGMYNAGTSASTEESAAGNNKAEASAADNQVDAFSPPPVTPADAEPEPLGPAPEDGPNPAVTTGAAPLDPAPEDEPEPASTSTAGGSTVPTTNVPTTNVPTTNVPTTNVPTTNVPTTNDVSPESDEAAEPARPQRREAPRPRPQSAVAPGAATPARPPATPKADDTFNPPVL